jgi:hypothetical protein
MSAATADGRVCWVDADWDRSSASDGVSRYGAYLRTHTKPFAPWQDEDAPGGITQDPADFAIAAFTVATGPIMSPGYVVWHPRVTDYNVSRGENPEPGRLVLQVTLATDLPMWLGGRWWSWTERYGRRWREPDDDRPAALASLELRWPLATSTLPRPRPPRQPGVPNLADAKASVRALVEAINAIAGPVLAKLEGGEHR